MDINKSVLVDPNVQALFPLSHIQDLTSEVSQFIIILASEMVVSKENVFFRSQGSLPLI